MMNEATKRIAYEHATREHPREACGLVVVVKGVETYFACRNIAEGTDNFAIAPADYANAADAGDIVAVFHSHPDASAQPGQADRVACEQSGLPWYIVGVPNGQWCSLAPSGYVAPLVGREWGHGVLDCLSIIRDYYQQVLGVHIPDYERHDGWWYKGGNMYLDHYRDAGFRIIDPETESVQPHDVIVMQVMCDVPNHGAIYLPGDKMLHHLHQRLSGIDIYGGYWRKHTNFILRFTNADAATLRRISETVWSGS